MNILGDLRHSLSAFTAFASLGVSASEAVYSTDSVPMHHLDEVVVTGARGEVNAALLSHTVTIVSRTDVDNSLQPSLLPVLTEQVPGLFSTSRGVYGYGVSGGAAGTVSMRGLSGSSAQVLTLIDGHPQYSGIFGHPISDALQSMSVERVEVIRSPASMLYGSNAMGGVVNMITVAPHDDGIRTQLRAGYGSYNSLESMINCSMRFSRFSSIVSGSYNRSDNNRDNMDFSQSTLFAKLGYEVSSHWKLYTDVNLTHFHSANPGAENAPLTDADQSITRGAISVGIDNSYGNFLSGGASMFFNWGHHYINDGYTADAAPKPYRFVSDDNMAGVSLWETLSPFSSTAITLGADWFRYSGKAWNHFVEGEQMGEDKLIVSRWHNEFAGYVDIRQAIGSLLTLNAGVRVDNNDALSTEWIPKGGFSLKLPFGANLKGSVSKGFRYPTLKEMYMFGPTNPDLKSESSLNYEVDFSQSLLDGALTYGVNLFFIDADNIILTLPNPDGAGMSNMNSGRIINKGFELQVAWRISQHWSVDANYSYVHMNNPVPAAPGHKLYVGGMFAAKRWSITSGVQYVSGLYTSTSLDSKESFVLWNLRAQFRATKWLSLWARGENLLAQRYEINAGYQMPRATFFAGVSLSF